MALAYWLKTNGDVERIHLPPEITNINDVIPFDDTYMTSIGSIWLYMHNDNDFEENLQKTTLPVNQVLRQYVGDILAVKAVDEESDEIDVLPWSVETIKS